MKKELFTIISISAVLLILSGQLFAQSPQAFNYQAIARDASGDLLANQLLGIRLTIHQSSASGTTVYAETHSPTTNEFGLFTIEIGQGTVVSGTFSSIEWDKSGYWLQVEMDPAGGTSYSDMGTDQLLSVPYALYSNNTGSLGIVGTSGQTMRHNGTDWVASGFLYNSGSSIGIGTSTPPFTLSLQNPSGNTDLSLLTSTSGSTANDGLRIGIGSGSLNTWIWNYENTRLYFGTNNLERMSIGADGNIGIGTSSPSALLDIHSNSTVPLPQLRLYEDGNDYARLTFSNSNTAAFWTVAGYINAENAWSKLNFYHSVTGDIMTIQGDGKVGIGIISPTYKLQVHPQSTVRHTGYFDNSYACGNLYATTGVPLTNGTCALIGDFNGTGTNDGIGVYGKAIDATNGNGFGGFFEGKYIGVVGRGGSGGLAGVYAYSNGATNAIYINGNIAGTGTDNYSSDAKLKQNIRTIDGALDNIMKMKPSVYEFRVGEFGSMELPEGEHYGLVAQDLLEIYPDLVIENDFLGEGRAGSFKYYGINYRELIPILIKGIQEQQEEINALKVKISELEK